MNGYGATARIVPLGWMREFLIRDGNGITGNLDRLNADAGCDIFSSGKTAHGHEGSWSTWWPGETRGAWSDAFVNLAYFTGDPSLISRADALVAELLDSQEADGYIGIYLPKDRYGSGERNGDLWVQSRILNTLLSAYRHTGRSDVLDAAFRLADLIVTQYGPGAQGRSFYETQEDDGSKTHGLMIIEPLLQLHDRSGKREYLEFCEFLYKDYSMYGGTFPASDLRVALVTDPSVPFVGHGPHTCEQLRLPLLLWAASGRREYLSAFRAGWAKMKRNLTLSGACKSDELIGAFLGFVPEGERARYNLGRSYPLPNAAYEYCATTELLLSLTAAFDITGDAEFAEQAEWLAYNAAMAARRSDGKAIQYCCADNMYEASHAFNARWDYSPTHQDAAVCCAPNSGRMLPAFLNGMWKVSEGAIAAIQYGPNRLEARLPGGNVTLLQETDYPFGHRVRITCLPESETQVSLSLRLPGWRNAHAVTLDGAPCEARLSGNMLTLAAPLEPGGCVEIAFSALPEAIKAVDGTMALRYGALLFSLNIREEGIHWGEYPIDGFYDTDYFPAKGEGWDYTLLLSEAYPPQVNLSQSGGYPWDCSPVTLKVMALNRFAQPGYIALVPIGCTTLRRTAFPAVLPAEKPVF